MARRVVRLGVRIMLFVLLLLGPMLIVLCAVALDPRVPERLAKPLLLVSGIWFFSAILLAPAFLFRDPGSSGADGDGGGGGGGQPPRTPTPPAPPRGGIPLPDADQAAVRVRDHGRLAWPRLRRRRSRREPERAPALPPPS